MKILICVLMGLMGVTAFAEDHDTASGDSSVKPLEGSNLSRKGDFKLTEAVVLAGHISQYPPPESGVAVGIYFPEGAVPSTTNHTPIEFEKDGKVVARMYCNVSTELAGDGDQAYVKSTIRSISDGGEKSSDADGKFHAWELTAVKKDAKGGKAYESYLTCKVSELISQSKTYKLSVEELRTMLKMTFLGKTK